MRNVLLLGESDQVGGGNAGDRKVILETGGPVTVVSANKGCAGGTNNQKDKTAACPGGGKGGRGRNRLGGTGRNRATEKTSEAQQQGQEGRNSHKY